MSLLTSPLRTARQGRTLGWRAMLKIKHSPDLLLDIIALPVVFVLMYVFLFGNAISGNWHAYLQFVLPGIAVQAMMFGSLGTALALNTDLRTGIFDRFRSLPIGRTAPLIGQVLGDLVRYAVSLVLVFGPCADPEPAGRARGRLRGRVAGRHTARGRPGGHAGLPPPGLKESYRAHHRTLWPEASLLCAASGMMAISSPLRPFHLGPKLCFLTA